MWTSACLVKTEEKEKIRVASRFYDRTLLLRVWRGLKHYRSVKKLKQLRHGMCPLKCYLLGVVHYSEALAAMVCTIKTNSSKLLESRLLITGLTVLFMKFNHAVIETNEHVKFAKVHCL